MGGPTGELPSETPGSVIDGVPDETDAQEERNEENVDIEMGFLDVVKDLTSTALMEQLGYVEDEEEFVAQNSIGSKQVVSEVNSLPRITQELKSRRRRFGNLVPGIALDLIVGDPDDGQPWDFYLKSKRDQARRLLRESKPILLIGSPMCKALSTWQRLNCART